MSMAHQSTTELSPLLRNALCARRKAHHDTGETHQYDDGIGNRRFGKESRVNDI